MSQPHIKTFRIINVMASSIDGFVAASDGQTDSERHDQGFTSSEDRDHLDALIRSADAILLGSKTMSAAQGALDVPKEDGTYPVWITFTNRGIPAGNGFWKQQHIPRWTISSDPLPSLTPDVQNFHYGDEDLVDFTLRLMETNRFSRVLLFGGGEINRLFYQKNAVDELIVTICPILVVNSQGVPIVNPGIKSPVQMILKNLERQNNLIFAHYLINKEV